MKDKSFLKLIQEADPEYSGPITTTGFLDTGSYILNAACSTSIWGGIPNNRITAVHSKAGVGKTYLAMSAVKALLQSDPIAQALFFDTEFAIDEDFLLRRDIDPDRVFIQQPATIEEFKTKALKFLDAYGTLPDDKRQRVIMVLDSLGMLPSIKEDTDGLNGKDVRDMTKQQGVRSLFRTATQKLGKLNIPMFVCAHSYTDIMSYGAPQKMAGGGGLEYAASTILGLTKEKDTEKVKIGGKDVTVHDGNIIHVNVQKSRFSREGRKIAIKLHFQRGVDRYYGLLPLAASSGIIKKVSTQYQMPDGSKHFEKHINEDPAKYFTQDILEKLEVAAKSYFSLGSSSQEMDLTEVDSDGTLEDNSAE